MIFLPVTAVNDQSAPAVTTSAPNLPLPPPLIVAAPGPSSVVSTVSWPMQLEDVDSPPPPSAPPLCPPFGLSVSDVAELLFNHHQYSLDSITLRVASAHQARLDSSAVRLLRLLLEVGVAVERRWSTAIAGLDATANGIPGPAGEAEVRRVIGALVRATLARPSEGL